MKPKTIAKSTTGFVRTVTFLLVMLFSNSHVNAQGYHHGPSTWHHHHDSIPPVSHDSGIVFVDTFFHGNFDSTFTGHHLHHGLDSIPNLNIEPADSISGNQHDSIPPAPLDSGFVQVDTFFHGNFDSTFAGHHQHHGLDTLPNIHPGDSINGNWHDSIPNGGVIDTTQGGFGHDTIPSGGPQDTVPGGWIDSLPNGGPFDTISGGPNDTLTGGGCTDTTGTPHHRNMTLPANSAIIGNNSSIGIYPNPMSESAVINIAGTKNEVTFRLYDCTGRMAMVTTNLTNGNYTLNRDNLSPGIYIYQILDGSAIAGSGKIIMK